MKIEPMSHEEAKKIGLLEKGVYQFEVFEAIEKESKSSGNPMLELHLKVWGENGKTYFITDYLVYEQRFEYKLRHFLYSVDCGTMSESGDIDVASLVNKCGECRVYIAEDKNGQYPPKNAVSDYVVPKPGENKEARAEKKVRYESKVKETDMFNDEIPF